MEKDLLIPAYKVMPVWADDEYVYYPLSRVLASHGFTIRDIRVEDSSHFSVAVRSVDEFKQISVESAVDFSLIDERPKNFFDLILRYRCEEDMLHSPVCVKALYCIAGDVLSL